MHKRLKKISSRPGIDRLLGKKMPAAAAPTSQPLRDKVEKAVEAWFDMPPVSLEEVPDPLKWWASAISEQIVADSLRFLAPLARKYLAIPGVNGSIEQVWSAGRRVLVFNRHSPSGNQVDMLLTSCWKMWPPEALPLL